MIQAIDKRLLVFLIIAFVITAIAVIVSHEVGHFIVAKYFGYSPYLEFDHTNFNYEQGHNNLSIDGQIIFNARGIWMLIGGPAETILIGTIGLLFLFIIRRQPRRENPLRAIEWMFVALSLFWMRFLVNFVIWICRILYLHKLSFGMDEIKISRLINIPIWIIPLVSAMMAVIILAIVLFKFIPKIQRPVFLISLALGGISGCLLWLWWLGPLLLP